MNIIQAKAISLQFTDQPLFDDLNISIKEKDKVAILGRNGAGKSTFLKVILGKTQPDSGTIEIKAHNITMLDQELPQHLDGTVEDYIRRNFHSSEDWEQQYKIEKIVTDVNLKPEDLLQNLSGGQLRRCLLAAALVNEPDVLLLDEPTNHMDIETIQWLEKTLKQINITLIIITHDRSFLQNVADTIIEIDRGKAIYWKGSYVNFLQHKEQQLAAEEQANILFDKRLAEEERWIRQGIKARRTRNEGRVRQLKKMRETRAQRREQVGKATIESAKSRASGKIVIEAENINVSYDNTPIITDFSCIIQRGDKIGIVGPNGCGKSTLINTLLKKEKPTSGSVKLGTQLDIIYFDQKRSQLNETNTVMDEVADGQTMVTINGQSKHVISYLQDFLFTPIRARSIVKILSGGERNRLLLAKLLLKPANILVLDEPTNDLDIETLELLEEFLLQFNGTLLLISHDRTFLNNIVSSTYVYQGNAKFQEFIGGYDEITPSRQVAQATKKQTAANKTSNSSNTAQSSTLSYEERKEIQKLPKKIETLENKISLITEKMSQPDFYQQQTSDIEQQQNNLMQLEEQLKNTYHRWEQLLDKE